MAEDIKGLDGLVTASKQISIAIGLLNKTLGAGLPPGTVSITGSPASGNLTKFSGATTITNGDLSGDITTSGTLTTTLATVNSNVGTFASITVNGKGLVTAAANLTGDITSSGSATTLATVNSNTGSFGSSTAIPNFTVNGKGLITAAGTNVVIAPAGTLTGTTLASNVVTSSLTSVGTLGSLTVTGNILNSALTASSAVATDASKNLISITNTGTGNNVLSDSPTFTTIVNTAALTASSTVTGLTFVPTGAGVPTNGMYLPAANTLAFSINSTPVGRFLSTTVFLVNCTSQPSSSVPGVSLSNPLNVAASSSSVGSATTAVTHWNWINGNGTVGSISTNASATAYNTSSDQRLKENPQSINSGTIIDALNPYKFTWKCDGTDGYGVFAQEAYKVFPQAVHLGTDEIGDDGKLKQPWGVDYSAFVPLLLSEVKSLRLRVANLEKI